MRSLGGYLVLGLAMLAIPLEAAPLAPTLTLAQTVARVESAGFDVRIARAETAMAAADAGNARALLLPQIGLNATALDANEPQLGMPIARQSYLSATLAVPLFTPANAATARASRQSATAATLRSDGTASDAMYAATVAYRRVQLGDAVLTAREAALADQQRHLKVTEERVAAGALPRYVILRDRAAFAAATAAREDAAAERDDAAADLQDMLDMSSDRIAVEPLAIAVYAGSQTTLLARALAQRPDVLAAAADMSAAQSTLVAARAAYLPSATLSAQSYNGNASPMLGRGGGQVLVTATLPIVDGGTRAASIARARAALDRATAVRDRMQADVVRDVVVAWRDYEAAQRNVNSADAMNADAQEQLRLAELRASIGKAIDLEVLDALNVAASARETQARSIARLDIAVAALHRAAGDRAL